MMKWRVLTLFCINMYRITQERYSIFLSMIVKSTPVFPVFSVGRNEHKFVICLRVKVFTCNYFDLIFSGAPWVKTETILFDKNRNFIFFLDFHSILHFGPYYLKHGLTSWFVIFSIIFCLNSDFYFVIFCRFHPTLK